MLVQLTRPWRRSRAPACRQPINITPLTCAAYARYSLLSTSCDRTKPQDRRITVPTRTITTDTGSRNRLRDSTPPSSVIAPAPATPASVVVDSGSTLFSLQPEFVQRQSRVPPKWGFNGLGELVYRRTYSRERTDGTHENWPDTVERVVNGTFRMQQRWCAAQRLGWDEARSQEEAQEMYERIYRMKFLPPGRGLWAMGSPLTEERRLFAALNNCGFVSTDTLRQKLAEPFCFLMDASMLGIGVGFDTKGAGTVIVRGVNRTLPAETMVIPDTREGWVDALRRLLLSHFHGLAPVLFDVSLIRPEGEPIRGFGGVSAGPQVLLDMLSDIDRVLESEKGKPFSIRAIVDIMNLIGRCVVAGNVRRTAEIAFGPHDSTEYLHLKDYTANPERAAYGWSSNNSIFAPLGMNYKRVTERIRVNGEPGMAWLDNMRNFGRMGHPPDYKDSRASGGNPCLEQTLESWELCCLVETFPDRHADLEDYMRTLEFAMLYAKTVTLGTTHWEETNRVMQRNRRIGCSQSGLAQFITHRGIDTLRLWCTRGYAHVRASDRKFSERFGVPESIKTTSIKPSGTVSLLAGATPGMHYPESEFYIRRVRLGANSDLVPPLRAANYHIEPSVDAPNDTLVVEVPVSAGKGIRTIDQISMWEQLSLAAFLQSNWANNQVSATVTFDPETEGPHLEHALNYFQYQLKGISCLPRVKKGAFPQMPYEAITEAVYNERVAALKPLVFREPIRNEPVLPERGCDGDRCAFTSSSRSASSTAVPSPHVMPVSGSE